MVGLLVEVDAAPASEAAERGLLVRIACTRHEPEPELRSAVAGAHILNMLHPYQPCSTSAVHAVQAHPHGVCDSAANNYAFV